MDDPQASPVGTAGTARGVDEIGYVMVAWDKGFELNKMLDEDVVKIIME